MTGLSRRLISRGLASITFTVIVAACSVMQVDVDVYKGPLANHKDVQTEQIAVMAVGAEPLIKRLREGLIDAGLPAKDPLVVNVDDILTLYSDRDKLSNAGPVLRLLDLTESDLSRIARHYNILNGVHVTQEFEPLISDLNWIIASKNTGNDQRELAEAFRDFLKPREPGESEIRPYWGPLRTSKRYGPGFIRANRAYLDLQDEAYLAEQAEILFSETVFGLEALEKRSSFVSEVKRIAKSFGSSREAIHDIFVNYVKLLALLPSTGFTAPEAANKEMSISVVAEEISSLLNPLHALLAFSGPNSGARVLALRYPFLDALEDNASTEALARALRGGVTLDSVPLGGLSKDQKGAIRKILFDLMVKFPEKMSHAILDADRAFVEQTPPILPGMTAERWERLQLEDDAVRAFGLSRGPDRLFNTLIRIEKKNKEIRTQIRNNVRSLYHGRINDGLYTLIERYLNANFDEVQKPCEDARPCAESDLTDTDHKRELLFDVLVRFAQKVLFVVNHERLFTAFASGDATGPSTKSYVQVLQTVGNSILVHVDAMRQLKSHSQALRDAKAREAAAVKQAFGGGPGDMFDRLITSLRSETEAATTVAGRLNRSLSDARAELAEMQKDLTAAQVVAQVAAQQLKNSQPPSGYDLGFERFLAARAVLDGNQAVKSGIALLIASAAVTPADLYGEIKTVIQTAALNAAGGATPSAESLQLGLAFDAFDQENLDKGLPAVTANTTKAERLAQIGRVVDARLLAEKKKVEPLKVALKAAQDADARAKKVVADKTAEIATKTAEQATLQKETTAAASRLKTLIAAAADATSRRSDALKGLNNNSARPLGKTVHTRLEALLRNEGKTDSADVVEKLPVPIDPPLPAVLDSGQVSDSKQVLDSLIALLRQEYTLALKENDIRSSQVNQAAAALAESYKQRADMIYLRPAMAYLRTSFTATTLQDNRLAWQNLLSNHGLRTGVPFVPEWIAEERARVTEELDKQFWHNINRVRVAGAGDTNYAIAKDDLGNWYVKSYSTDVEDIINSARNLGMFAAGVPNFEVTSPSAPATPGTPAADQVPVVPSEGGVSPVTGTTGTTDEETPSTRRLSKQHQLFADKFSEQTFAALSQAQTVAATLPDQLEAAWTAAKFSDEQLSDLVGIAQVRDEEPLNQQLLGVTLSEEEAALHADQLVTGLRAIKLYHDRVVRGVFRLPSKSDEEPDGLTSVQRTRAGQVVADVVLVQSLKPLLGDSVSSADQYETALEIIGQTSGL